MNKTPGFLFSFIKFLYLLCCDCRCWPSCRPSRVEALCHSTSNCSFLSRSNRLEQPQLREDRYCSDPAKADPNFAYLRRALLRGFDPSKIRGKQIIKCIKILIKYSGYLPSVYHDFLVTVWQTPLLTKLNTTPINFLNCFNNGVAVTFEITQMLHHSVHQLIDRH